MTLEWDELRAVVVLSEELHFGRAAAKLWISQPALTKQIKRVEAKIGGLLFRRSTGGVSVTDAGIAIAERARLLLFEAQSVFSFAEKAMRGYTERLRLGFGVATIPDLVPNSVIAFRKLHPDIQIEMRDMSTPSQVQALLDGSVDVGFVRLPRNESEIESIPIQKDELVVVASAESGVDLGRRGLTLMRDQPFILISPSASRSLHHHAQELCRMAGFSPRVVQEAEELFTLLHLVRSGMGISLVPVSAKRMRVPGLRFLSTRQKQAFWDIGIARSRKRVSGVIDEFISVVKKVATANKKRNLR